jgi:hypothetical protein
MAVINRTSLATTFSTTNNYTIPAVASGNSLLVLISALTARAPTTITDNGGGSPTYTLDIDAQQLENATHAHMYVYRRNNITSAPTQITVTYADNASGGVQIIEYDNLSAAGPVESNVATRTNTGSNTATITTGAANRIGIGASGSGDNARDHTTAESGWVAQSTPSGAVAVRFFDNPDLGAAGSKSLTTTVAPAQWIVTGMWAYAASGAPSAPKIIRPATIIKTQAATTSGTGSVD